MKLLAYRVLDATKAAPALQSKVRPQSDTKAAPELPKPESKVDAKVDPQPDPVSKVPAKAEPQPEASEAKPAPEPDDAAGKDGAIRHVMSGVNSQGCQVFSFKHPSATELLHDFLWRTARDLPERGRIGIFNRSYYEEVLIARVHPEILRNEGLPDSLLFETAVWQDRYRSILDLEAHLRRNGTRIVKFYLHLSKDEQRKRFLDRIDEPEKNWKFSQADVEERKFWNHYMTAYEECVSATSTPMFPGMSFPPTTRITLG